MDIWFSSYDFFRSLWSKTEKNTEKIAIQSLTFPRVREWAKWVSKRANEWVQRSARAKRVVRSKRTSERCERTSEWTSEWPSTYVSLLVCFQTTVFRNFHESRLFCNSLKSSCFVISWKALCVSSLFISWVCWVVLKANSRLAWEQVEQSSDNRCVLAIC